MNGATENSVQGQETLSHLSRLGQTDLLTILLFVDALELREAVVWYLHAIYLRYFCCEYKGAQNATRAQDSCYPQA